MTHTPLLRRPPRAGLGSGTFILAVFLLLAVPAAIFGRGFLEADGVLFFLYSKYALASPVLLTDVWGRPFRTALYLLPAQFGILPVRLTSIALTLLTAALVWRTAVILGMRRPVLAVVGLLGSPLLFLHSFSELTELPFALLTATLLYAYASRRWWLLALAAGLMPLARPEGFAVMPAAVIVILLHLRWRGIAWMLLAAMPLVVWNFAGWWLSGRNGPWYGWLVSAFPYSAQSAYETRTAWRYLLILPTIVGPLLFPATLAGLLWAACRTRQAWNGVHRARVWVLAAGMSVAIIAGHTVLMKFGKLGSSGEGRYLLTIIPCLALMTAAGLERLLMGHLHLRRTVQIAGYLALAPVLINAYIPLVPLKEGVWFSRSREVEKRFRDLNIPGNPVPAVIVANPAVLYFMNVNPLDRTRVLPFNADSVANAPPGTWLIWEDRFGLANADVTNVIDPANIDPTKWKRLIGRIDELSNMTDEEASRADRVNWKEMRFEPDNVRWRIFIRR